VKIIIREHAQHSNKLQNVRDLFFIIGFSCGCVSGISGDISFSDVVFIVFYYDIFHYERNQFFIKNGC
jgi:hypothetical protein